MSHLVEQKMLRVGKQQDRDRDYSCKKIGTNPSSQKNEQAYFRQCSNSDIKYYSIPVDRGIIRKHISAPLAYIFLSVYKVLKSLQVYKLKENNCFGVFKYTLPRLYVVRDLS